MESFPIAFFSDSFPQESPYKFQMSNILFLLTSPFPEVPFVSLKWFFTPVCRVLGSGGRTETELRGVCKSCPLLTHKVEVDFLSSGVFALVIQRCYCSWGSLSSLGLSVPLPLGDAFWATEPSYCRAGFFFFILWTNVFGNHLKY